MSDHFSPFPSCFRHPTTTTTTETSSDQISPPMPISANSNLITCLYHTDHGLFTLTWSRTLFGRSLYLHLDNNNLNTLSPPPASLSTPLSLSSPYFHLHIKPFMFWKKFGSKKLIIEQTTTKGGPAKTVQIYWDLRRAKFGSGTEPQSGFYIAAMVDGEMTLLAGDSPKEAYERTRAVKPKRRQILILRREHVFGNRVYTTKAEFGGRTKEIRIESNLNNEDPRLIFTIDNKRVLQVKHLKWKFRGNERIEADGVHIQVSWDVYNWLFDDREIDQTSLMGGHALFMFKFEKPWFDEDYEEEERETSNAGTTFCGFGMSGFERKKMSKKQKSLLKAKSFSSSSISSSASSSGCSSSVLEWASMEEKELESTTGFSLLVYAWKS